MGASERSTAKHQHRRSGVRGGRRSARAERNRRARERAKRASVARHTLFRSLFWFLSGSGSLSVLYPSGCHCVARFRAHLSGLARSDVLPTSILCFYNCYLFPISMLFPSVLPRFFSKTLSASRVLALSRIVVVPDTGHRVLSFIRPCYLTDGREHRFAMSS